jgi:hypothetical protein
MSEDQTKSIDQVFVRLDAFVASLEDEGYAFDFILNVLRDYIELAEDYVL